MKNTRADNSQGKRSPVWIVLFVVCCIIIVFVIGALVLHKFGEKHLDDILESAVKKTDTVLSDETTDAPADDGSDSISNVTDEYSDSIKDEIVSIDFDMLRETAPDVYAWIEIPGTRVSFPIVQHPDDNGYYVRRSITGARDVTGCIFTENYNSTDFEDKNTLIYGHYMSDGTKFGSLLKYMDRDYFDSYRDIVIYTDTHRLEYKIFAAVPFDTRHVLRSYAVYENGFEMFLENVNECEDPRAVFADDISVDPEKDRIITLSTCLKTNAKRYLVLAVLTRSQYCE